MPHYPSPQPRLVLAVALLLALALALSSCDDGLVAETADADAALAKAMVEVLELSAFQPAGDHGGGVLTPGTMYPPTHSSSSKLVRHMDWLQFSIHTSGLPPGAYTVWWVIVNDPSECSATPCTILDIVFNPDTEAAVFWATGGIVLENGIGNFSDRTHVGELPGGDGQIFQPGPGGLQNPMGAEVHLIVKYHGPASDDPEVLYEQTHTLLGSCDSGANAQPNGQCFDPQAAVHLP